MIYAKYVIYKFDKAFFHVFLFIPTRNKENISKAKQKYKKKNYKTNFFFSFCSIMIGMKFFRGYYFTWEFYPQMKWKAKTFLKNYFHIKNVILFTDDFVKLLWNLPFITLTASLLTVLKSSSHLTFFQYCLQYCQKKFYWFETFYSFYVTILQDVTQKCLEKMGWVMITFFHYRVITYFTWNKHGILSSKNE